MLGKGMSGTKFKPQRGLSSNVGALVLALPGICCMTLNESLSVLCFQQRGVLLRAWGRGCDRPNKVFRGSGEKYLSDEIFAGS